MVHFNRRGIAADKDRADTPACAFVQNGITRQTSLMDLLRCILFEGD